jgi:hypothetical protein
VRHQISQAHFYSAFTIDDVSGAQHRLLSLHAKMASCVS